MEHLEDTLHFFDAMPGALPLYERLLAQAQTELGPFAIRVQKTQITWTNRYVFACVSFLKIRKAKERPPVYLVVSFGLDHKIESPRIDGATEAYPQRWTHHVLIAGLQEIDAELIAWLREAYEFAVMKGHKGRK